jgi:hypothetical protein
VPVFIDRAALHAPEHVAATSGSRAPALSFAAASSLGFGSRLPCYRPLLEIAAAPLTWRNIAGRRRVALAQQPLGSAHADENSCVGVCCHERPSDLNRPFGVGLAHHHWHLDAHAGWTAVHNVWRARQSGGSNRLHIARRCRPHYTILAHQPLTESHTAQSPSQSLPLRDSAQFASQI